MPRWEICRIINKETRRGWLRCYAVTYTPQGEMVINQSDEFSSYSENILFTLIGSLLASGWEPFHIDNHRDLDSLVFKRQVP